MPTSRRSLSPARPGRRCALLLVALAALTGCIEADGACGPSEHRVAVGPRQAIDLLIVVDRTPSMANERDRVVALARLTAAILGDFSGGGPDLHAAVVSSDLGGFGVPGCTSTGDGARLQRARACGVDGVFLSDLAGAAGARERNYQGDLASALACMVDLPPSPCVVNQPLRAAAEALDGWVVAQSGFLRPNAIALVLVVTDGDDCSLRDPLALAAAPSSTSERERDLDTACAARGLRCDGLAPTRPGAFAGCVGVGADGLADPTALLRRLEAHASQGGIAFGVVAGPSEIVIAADGRLAPACAGAGPAPRLVLHSSRSVPQVASVCGDDWSSSLFLLFELARSAPPWACLAGVTDLDPAVPGLQAACHVTELAGDAAPSRLGRELRTCGEPPGDPRASCYAMGTDLMHCPSGATFAVVPGRDTPFGASVRIRCATTACPSPE